MTEISAYFSTHHPLDVSAKHRFISQRHHDFRSLDRIRALLLPESSHNLGQVIGLQIDHTGVIASIVNPSFKYLVNTNDSRDCAIESINFSGFEPADGFLIYNSCSFIAKSNTSFQVFDIGANAGWYSLAIASKFPFSSITSFEPVPYTYDLLCKNIDLNNFSHRISPINLAVHEIKGTADFYFSPSLSGNSSFSQNLQDTSDKIHLTVETIPIDVFINSNQLSPSFLKIDVEGAELFAVKSALNTIKRFKPLIFIELSRKWSKAFGYHPNEVISLLSSLDYHCLYLTDDLRLQAISSISESLPFTNFLFVPSYQFESFTSSFTTDLELL